jgi:hypothetical protein
MAKRKKATSSSVEADAAKEGFVVPGSKHALQSKVASFSVDLMVSMIADRIRNGEDPEDAAKAVLDLAKEFVDADEIIFDDDDDGVSIEEADEEKKDAD